MTVKINQLNCFSSIQSHYQINRRRRPFAKKWIWLHLNSRIRFISHGRSKRDHSVSVRPIVGESDWKLSFWRRLEIPAPAIEQLFIHLAPSTQSICWVAIRNNIACVDLLCLTGSDSRISLNAASQWLKSSCSFDFNWRIVALWWMKHYSQITWLQIDNQRIDAISETIQRCKMSQLLVITFAPLNSRHILHLLFMNRENKLE
jgi:hypothetical protein